MAFLKKVNENWSPKENPNVEVGDIVDFPGPIESLVRSGMAILVDKDGNEIELPVQVFQCPVCFEEVVGLRGFIDHVSTHKPKPKVDPKTQESSKEKERVQDGSKK